MFQSYQILCETAYRRDYDLILILKKCIFSFMGTLILLGYTQEHTVHIKMLSLDNIWVIS